MQIFTALSRHYGRVPSQWARTCGFGFYHAAMGACGYLMRRPLPLPGPVDVAGLRRLVPATADWQVTMDIGDAGAGFLAVRWRKAA